MTPARTSFALGALALALTPAAIAAAPHVSHAKFWQNQHATVACGIEIHPANQPPTKVICSAPGLPLPKTGIGDPFVEIGGHGKPHVVRRSQDSFPPGNPVTLKPGSKWSSLGVTCTVKAKTVRCVNKSGHGFHIGDGHYHHF